MALIARYFVDTSVLARMESPVVAERVAPILRAGLAATCAPLDAEDLYSARSPDDYEARRFDRRHGYEYVPSETSTGRRPSRPNVDLPASAGTAPSG